MKKIQVMLVCFMMILFPSICLAETYRYTVTAETPSQNADLMLPVYRRLAEQLTMHGVFQKASDDTACIDFAFDDSDQTLWSGAISLDANNVLMCTSLSDFGLTLHRNALNLGDADTSTKYLTEPIQDWQQPMDCDTAVSAKKLMIPAEFMQSFKAASELILEPSSGILYQDEIGKPVAVHMVMSAKSEQAEANEDSLLCFDYTRLTEGKTIAHHFILRRELLGTTTNAIDLILEEKTGPVYEWTLAVSAMDDENILCRVMEVTGLAMNTEDETIFNFVMTSVDENGYHGFGFDLQGTVMDEERQYTIKFLPIEGGDPMLVLYASLNMTDETPAAFPAPARTIETSNPKDLIQMILDGFHSLAAAVQE